MNHYAIFNGYGQIMNSLAFHAKDDKKPTNLDFVIEGLSLYALDLNSDAKVLLATNKTVNGHEMFAWMPEPVAYAAIDEIVESVKMEFRGTGAPASERNARLLQVLRDAFKSFGLNSSYEPR